MTYRSGDQAAVLSPEHLAERNKGIRSEQYFVVRNVLMNMHRVLKTSALIDVSNRAITAVIRGETARLTAFIRRRVDNVGDADDVLQDVMKEFVQACRLPEPIEQAGRWLMRAAQNRIIDRYRRQRVQARSESVAARAVDDDDERLNIALPGPDWGPEAELARATLLEALQRALDELPPEQREVFIAHEVDGTSFKDISARTGTSVNTLLSRKRYAVLQLRDRLQPIYDDWNS